VTSEYQHPFPSCHPCLASRLSWLPSLFPVGTLIKTLNQRQCDLVPFSTTKMDPSTTSHCEHLTHPSPLTTGLAAVLLVGILVSYLPQHLKILSRRSSEGLSPWWVLLGALSSIAALGNILTLPASRQDIGCCQELGKGECAAALLGVGQIGCQWTCFMFMYVGRKTRTHLLG